MSTPLISFTDKNDEVLEVYLGVGGVAFYSHKKGRILGRKVWLSKKDCDSLCEMLQAWGEYIQEG